MLLSTWRSTSDDAACLCLQHAKGGSNALVDPDHDLVFADDPGNSAFGYRICMPGLQRHGGQSGNRSGHLQVSRVFWAAASAPSQWPRHLPAAGTDSQNEAGKRRT